jgi:tetratricopeptide (TPR) repeat protein
MLGILNPFNLEWYFQNPLLLVALAFQLWMLVDAIRRQEWLWVIFIIIFPLFNAILYYFLVYRAQPSATQGFELPGTYKRHRIRELQAQIHHLDKAHHHAELGDVYFQQGKLDEAEKCYRAAIERDSGDPDFHAHLGQCLLRLGKAHEAAPLLERVVKENPRHDYGHTLMAYAETLDKLGQKDAAIETWKSVLEHHSYARARVQLAQLHAEVGEKELAKKELTDFLADEAHGVSFQKHRDKLWIKKAKAVLRQLK